MALHHDPHWPRAGAWFSAEKEGEVDIALIGVCAHESAITPNSAHKTPKAVRKALQRYSTWNQTCQIDFSEHLVGADFGDVADPENQRNAEYEIEQALFQTNFLIAIGGDNSITFSGVMGLAKAVGGLEKVGLITLDAHHDVRDGISNGSPIRQLVEAGLPGEHIVQIGISDFANSKFYADRVKEYGIHVIDRARMRSESLQDIASTAISIAGENHRAIYLDIDMDVCDRSAAPGCPAATPGGLSADEVRQLVALLTADPRVRMADITEIDATLDSDDGRTVRLAALVILEIATSRALLKI
ncbi:MAG: agmatinase family protein [Actinomycetes bacterium]